MARDRRRSNPQLTPLELEIMKVLWESGPSTVQAVLDKMSRRKLAYTTVQTMLNVLHRKGHVTRAAAAEGRAYLYQPTTTREKATKHAVGDLVDRLFGGSAENLVLNMVRARQLKPEELERISRLVEEAEEAGEAPDDDR
jgi:BlaI family transcriptional regulator, penicillinase repressor